MRHLRLLAILVIASLALVVSGCGNKEEESVVADTEGIYVTVGGLLYQVQISRYLNPRDPEDKFYFAGLPSGQSTDEGKEDVWFGVFMRVQNETKQTRTPTTQFSITDTQDNTYRPVALNARTNPFTFDARTLGPGQVSPEPESPAAAGTIQGGLLLFKIKDASLQNRPLELHIEGGAGQAATIDLDV
jgi:hypothetical protein